MEIIKCAVGDFQANCYIVFDEVSLEGIVIDAGDEGEKIAEICIQNNLKIKYVVLTHAHIDHIGGVCDLKKSTGSEILMNKEDEFLISEPPSQLKMFHSNFKKFDVDRYIADGDVINVAGTEFRVIETPGHTPGGICLLHEDCLFSGDTLFRDSVGRTDFEYGSFSTLINSIKTKLLVLKEDTIVYPGHDRQTTIGYEKYNNYYLSE